MKNNKTWTYQMYKKVLDQYPFKGEALAEEMDVSKSMLNDKAATLRCTFNQELTKEEKSMIRLYGRKLGDACMFLMPNRTQAEVHRELCAIHYC